jgi:hypothetical protein
MAPFQKTQYSNIPSCPLRLSESEGGQAFQISKDTTAPKSTWHDKSWLSKRSFWDKSENLP